MSAIRFSLAVVVALVVALVAWPLVDAMQGQVTAYPVLEGERGLLALNRSVFKVFPETQTVVRWTPGVREEPTRLAACVVRDRLYWRCVYDDRSATLTMSDGLLGVEPKGKPPIRYTDRVTWWRAYLGLGASAP